MKRFIKGFLAFVGALVLLSWVTGYGYIWGGMRETYFRGWKNSNIDDLEFRDVVTLPAVKPQPWPEALLPESALSEASAEASAAPSVDCSARRWCRMPLLANHATGDSSGSAVCMRAVSAPGWRRTAARWW